MLADSLVEWRLSVQILNKFALPLDNKAELTALHHTMGKRPNISAYSAPSPKSLGP